MSKIVVADADALIALSLENDPHHHKAVAINHQQLGFKLVDETNTPQPLILPLTVINQILLFHQLSITSLCTKPNLHNIYFILK